MAMTNSSSALSGTILAVTRERPARSLDQIGPRNRRMAWVTKGWPRWASTTSSAPSAATAWSKVMGRIFSGSSLSGRSKTVRAQLPDELADREDGAAGAGGLSPGARAWLGRGRAGGPGRARLRPRAATRAG